MQRQSFVRISLSLRRSEVQLCHEKSPLPFVLWDCKFTSGQQRGITMFRKVTIALFATAALSTAALAPTSASAWENGGWHRDRGAGYRGADYRRESPRWDGYRREGCGFRGLRPGIPIERGHAFRSKAATCSEEGGRGVVAGMRSWVSFSWLRQDWRAGQ